MGTFSTKRESNADEKIKALLEAKNARKEALKNLNTKSVIEAQEAKTQKELEEIDRQNEVKAATEATLAKLKHDETIRRGKMNRTGMEYRLVREGVELLKKRVLFEMAYNAFYLDDSVKARPEIIEESYETYKEVSAFLESTCCNSKTADSKKSKFMEAVDQVIQETAEKATKRICEQAKCNEETDIQFDLTDDEQEELDDKLSNLGKDEIEELVKEKVVTVVNDEKEAGEKKADFFKELDDANKDSEGDEDDGGKEDGLDGEETPEETGDDSKTGEDGEEGPETDAGDNSDDEGTVDDEVNQKDDSDDSKDNSDEEGEKPAKEGLDEVGSITDTNPDSFNQENEAIKESVDVRIQRLAAAKNRRNFNNAIGGTVFESLMLHTAKRTNEIVVTEGYNSSKEEIMSAVLVESALAYTVLETMNTLGVYQFTDADVNKIKSTLMGKVRGISEEPVTEARKMIRIHTKKYKRNNDSKIMKSNGMDIKIGEPTK